MEALAGGGRCAVIVPEGLAYGSTSAHVELRRTLVDQYRVLAVVSIPAGVFKPYAGVQTAALIFAKPNGTNSQRNRKNEKVWFFEIGGDGYDPARIVGGGRPETPEQNDIPELLRLWAEYRRSKPSQMVTGFKSALLKPFDHFFRKNGVTEIPIKVTGKREHPSFGLDFHHKNKSPS